MNTEKIIADINRKNEEFKLNDNEKSFESIVAETRDDAQTKADDIRYDRYESLLNNLNTKTVIPAELPIPGRAQGIKKGISKLINFSVTPRNAAQNEANLAIRDTMNELVAHNREQQREIDELKARLSFLENYLSENIEDTDEIRIIQLVPSLRRGDGVGNDVLAIHNFLKNTKKIKTRIFYESCGGTFSKDDARSINELPVLRDSDIIILHIAIYWTFNEKIKDLRGRKIFVYHNITPAEFFAPYNQISADACQMGIDQVKSMKDIPDYCLADSEFNKNDLISYGYKCPIDVLPIIIPFEDYDKNPNEDTLKRLDDGMTNILFVGRICPNKKQEDIIRAFSYYKKYYNPTSRLILLGGYDDNDLYYKSLVKYIDELKVENVEFTRHVSFDCVIATLKSADVFVCLSEHEGFCIPLLEAMHFEIPIVAYNSTAVTLTMGKGGVLLTDKDPLTVAGAIDSVVKNAELREEIKEDQREHLKEYSYDAISEKLWKYLTAFEPKLEK